MKGRRTPNRHMLLRGTKRGAPADNPLDNPGERLATLYRQIESPWGRRGREHAHWLSPALAEERPRWDGLKTTHRPAAAAREERTMKSKLNTQIKSRYTDSV